MRGLLLDNQSATVVARQVRVHRPECPIESLHRWRDGEFVRSSDARILAAAAEEGLVLITRDLRTIPGLLRSLALAGQSHGGVVLIDDRTIDERDVGGLVRALVEFWEEYREVDLASTVVHLKRASAC